MDYSVCGVVYNRIRDSKKNILSAYCTVSIFYKITYWNGFIYCSVLQEKNNTQQCPCIIQLRLVTVSVIFLKSVPVFTFN